MFRELHDPRQRYLDAANALALIDDSAANGSLFYGVRATLSARVFHRALQEIDPTCRLAEYTNPGDTLFGTLHRLAALVTCKAIADLPLARAAENGEGWSQMPRYYE